MSSARVGERSAAVAEVREAVVEVAAVVGMHRLHRTAGQLAIKRAANRIPPA